MNTYLIDNYVSYAFSIVSAFLKDFVIPILCVIALLYLIKYLKNKTD